MTSDRLKFILAAFIVLLAVGTAGFMAVEKLSPLDAFYMTIVTIATVGYGDIVPETAAGKVFTMVLIICGVGMTYYSFTYLFGLVVEGQLKNLMGRRGMNRKIASLHGHIIVCGAGRVGGNVIRRLRHEAADYVVIENSQETYALLMEDKETAVHGDATRDEVLLAAGIERAKGVITTLSHDADNVYVTLTAKSLNPRVRVVSRAERPEAEEKLRRAGADTVIFPSVMGGRQMVSAVTRPVIMDFVENVFYNQELHLDIAEIAVSPESVLAGVRLAASGIKEKFDSIVVAVKRGNELITTPSANMVIDAGDIMIVLGHRASLGQLVAAAKGAEA
ncbi:potassium channel family protein [Anaeroselena agilis]|uniref:Potassium channel protein n=1 Tax=Anaeroselena agilis TaxID=3063788 RepID=A0ABU3NSY4_9FIRM|nr:potassium channel protein [Selenomonadales bacterium 4137-cl]